MERRVFCPEDGGKTWRLVLDRDRHVYDVTIDPRNSKFFTPPDLSRPPGYQLIVAPTGRGFRALTKWGQRVISDPVDPEKVYITTFGGGVWHGSIHGEDRPLDIVTRKFSPEDSGLRIFPPRFRGNLV
jgi:hypothetical protein